MTRATASAICFHCDSPTASCFPPLSVNRQYLNSSEMTLSTLKPMQSRIERAMLHLKEVVRGPLNVFAYLMTVPRTIEKRPKNKHVQRVLENASLLCPFFDRRHPTLDRCDGRLPTNEPSRTDSQDGPVDNFRPMRVSNLESAVFGVQDGSSPIRSSRLNNCLTRLTQERRALVVIHPLTRTDEAGLPGSQQQSGRYLTSLLRVSDDKAPQ
jgi:hypothetical protein